MSWLSTAKDIGEMAKAIANVELQRKVLDLQAEGNELVAENNELKQENRELKREIAELKAAELADPNFAMDGEVYFQAGDPIPFCTRCAEGKVKRHLARRGGSRWACNECHSSYAIHSEIIARHRIAPVSQTD